MSMQGFHLHPSFFHMNFVKNKNLAIANARQLLLDLHNIPYARLFIL